MGDWLSRAGKWNRVEAVGTGGALCGTMPEEEEESRCQQEGSNPRDTNHKPPDLPEQQGPQRSGMGLSLFGAPWEAGSWGWEAPLWLLDASVKTQA